METDIATYTQRHRYKNIYNLVYFNVSLLTKNFVVSIIEVTKSSSPHLTQRDFTVYRGDLPLRKH